MNKLVFATNNAHKLAEVRAILESQFEIISLADLNCADEIPETADTLEGNALLKATYIHEKFGLDCFADDTGLEVEELGGEPGVYSARYAGEDHNSFNNMCKVLSLLENKTNRKACFRTVIALIFGNETLFFEGKIDGNITMQPRGESGFGYDPIFEPEGYPLSFAQLAADEKNQISHRALAVNKLIAFLQHNTN
ncbi:MAG: non-canonical purine NTP diphosphatase [Bacteroidota bacterium]|nr:non-canonical purine NTP diphosphatase [Bacteroidota bacterium]